MKKILLSVGVIITFIAYGFYQKVSGIGSVGPATTPGTITPSVNSSGHSAFNSTPTPVPGSGSPTPPGSSNNTTNTSGLKDGSYTGSAADAFYGLVQVQAVIQNGKITDVQFLQYPSDRRTSQMINSQAMGYLTSEAIQAQSANVNIVSGATDTSLAFIQSLSSALNQAGSSSITTN
jgi:uncharacterized protein with FMN-binding domain